MPACVTRMMGPARGDEETASVHEKLLSLFSKAGYEVIYPEVRTGCSCTPLLVHPSINLDCTLSSAGAAFQPNAVSESPATQSRLPQNAMQ